ncbi:MAG: alcohol dehydrogenase catalytic domain-containing protein [Kiritimatiellae bacterium]|nr:alcohol dehydrogenase catalytic domain-containing protein [Kiritimatiellia bacterium]
MKVAVKKGEQVRLVDRPPRELGPHEIRFDVAACGICGTDLHSDPDRKEEAGFGHEVAGTILEVGPGVTDLAPGTKVVLESASACGRCAACRNARQELCTNMQSFFFTKSFGFAEQMIAPAISAIPYEGLSPEVACLSEPLGVAIDMVRLAEITTDSNVLVMGPGPIGLMALALARRQGARRVFCSAFSREQARVALARAFGADAVVDPGETDLARHDFGCGIDRVLVTTPPPTLNDAIAIAGKGGIISLIGIGHGEQAYCRVDVNAFHFKKLQLRASFASPALFTPMALRYLSEGVIDGEALISHRFSLAEIEQAMETAHDRARAVKVVVTRAATSDLAVGTAS